MAVEQIPYREVEGWWNGLSHAQRLMQADSLQAHTNVMFLDWTEPWEKLQFNQQSHLCVHYELVVRGKSRNQPGTLLK